jgi:hypothetical protein
MAGALMTDNKKELEKCYEIWVKGGFDLDFYFSTIFDKALIELRKNTKHEIKTEIESGKYKALFVPVGYSIENIALVTAFIKPEYLSLAFSEITRRYHSKIWYLIENKLNAYCKNIDILDSIKSDDQKSIERSIVEWINRMTGHYHLNYDQTAIDLTGGTKPMSIGAQNAALSFGRIDAFYLKVDYHEQNLHLPIAGSERLLKLVKANSLFDPNLVFVVMPFRDAYNEVYSWIEETVNTAKLKCLRSDRDVFTGVIMDQVRANILKAKMVVAVVSGDNLNVYYELGMAHAFEKKVIILSENPDKLPFDIRPLNVLKYIPNDKNKFQQDLLKHIQCINS